MEPSRKWCTPILVPVALAVLAFTHDFLSLNELKVNTPAVSFNLDSPNNLLLPVLAVAVLGGLLICHISTHRYDLAWAFQHGYRHAPKLFALARAQIMEVSGGRQRDPHVGNIHATLRRDSYNLGQWTRPDGTLSPLVALTPDRKTHLHAVVHGIAHAVRPRLWAPFYAPALLALWALVSMTR